MREEIKELKKILMELNNQETTRLQISGTDWEEEEGNGNLNISYDQRSKNGNEEKENQAYGLIHDSATATQINNF